MPRDAASGPEGPLEPPDVARRGNTLIVPPEGTGGRVVDLDLARRRRLHRGDWWPAWAVLLVPSWFEDGRWSA